MKRPGAGPIIEPPEKVKALRHLRTLIEEDDRPDLNDLVSIKQALVQLQKVIDVKISNAVSSVMQTNNNAVSFPRDKPKMTDSEKVLSRVMSFLDTSTLLVCRRVCKKWCTIASNHVKTSTVISLYSLKNHTVYRRLSTIEFTRQITGLHRLFPCTKFDIITDIYTPMIRNFVNVYSMHLKHLSLKYMSSYAHWSNYLSDFKQILRLHQTPNCEHLKLRDWPCETLRIFEPEIPVHRCMKKLELDIIYDGQFANCLSSNSYFGKLLAACKSLISLNLLIRYKCKLNSGDMTQNIVDAINNAGLEKLKHLEINWTIVDQPDKDKVAAILDFTQLLPSSFKLKSLKLTDVSCQSLQTFLNFNSETLEDVDLHFSSRFTAANFNLDLTLVAQYLNNIKKLIIPGCLSEKDCETLLKLLMNENFPLLTKLKIEQFSKNFYPKAWPGFNSTVKKLSLSLDDNFAHVVPKLNTVIESFSCVEKLSIKYADQHVLRGIWKCNLKQTLCELTISQESKQSPVIYLYALDSILTGYDSADCRIILTEQINKVSFFDLETFKLDYWRNVLCKRATFGSENIAAFENLQKVKICFPRGHITEVSLIYMLISLKKLTSLQINPSAIRKYYVTNIRKLLPLSFHLNIKTVDDASK